MSEWTFGQKALVVLAALQLLWATAGFIAEPSFHIGADAPTEKVLGVDFNGYHALSGFLLFLPAFYFARRPDWALYYTLYVVVALYATGVWAFFTEQPAWVFTFPDNANDAIFHLATGTAFAVLAAIQWTENQRQSPNLRSSTSEVSDRRLANR
ncbi:MAG TPA: DUF4383 domain-containing protein [Solirubrobacterales bacterium]|nr:DUF4383 domain-containing protein [Solirubrobacterales bacterium]